MYVQTYRHLFKDFGDEGIRDDADSDYVNLDDSDEIPHLQGHTFPSEYLQPMQHLWKDPAIQAVLRQTSDVVIPDNMSYSVNETY